MDNFIFKPTSKENSSVEQKFYCLIGEEEFIDNDGYPRLNTNSKKVLAKTTVRDNITTFAVKVANNNKLYNPLDYGLQDKSYSIVDNVCRPQDKFRTVNENIFNLYLNFLTSKNITWLTQAEREIL